MSEEQSSEEPTELPPSGVEDDTRGGLHTTADVLELQRAVIENLPDAKVIVDETGRIVMVNHQTELMFGYPRGQMLGRPLEMLLPDRYRTNHVEHRRRYSEDPRTRPMGGADMPLWGQRKSGAEFRVEIMLAPIIISAGCFTIAIIRRVPVERANGGATAPTHRPQTNK